MSNNSSQDSYGPLAPTHTDKAYDEPIGPEQLAGPPPPEGFKANEGWVLVLGPGLARAAAYVGALKYLEKSGIQINAIVGTEMGAVVAALYSTRGISAVEWNITKLKKDTFADLPLLSMGGSDARGVYMDKFLVEAFSKKTFKDMKVPVFVALCDDLANEITAINSGDLIATLRDAVATRGLMKQRKNSSFHSAALIDPIPVDYAKALGMGKVLVLDVLSPVSVGSKQGSYEERVEIYMGRARELAERSYRNADAVIAIPTGDVGFLNVEMRAELAYRGRKATEEWVKRVTER